MAGIKISDLPPNTLPLVGDEQMELENADGDSTRATVADIASSASGLDATFITVSANAALPNERVLTAGTNVSLVDGGPNSTLTINVAGISFPLLAPDGSAVAPSYSFTNDSGAGMFLTALGELSFAADGVEIARAINLVNNQFAVAQSGSSSVPDLTSLADLDTGFRFPANNETVWIGGGSRAWNFSTVKFYSQFSNGPGLFNRVAQNDVVTVAPDHADDNTGLGASNDELSLIAGGIEIAQAKEFVGANQFIIAPGVVQNNEAAPSLAFGDGDTGFYEALANNLRVTIGGTERFFWEGDSFNAVAGTGPRMENLAAGATIPGFIPRRSDPNTGLASGGLDIVTLVAGGIESVRYAEVSSEVLQTNNSEIGIVASTTQTQGERPLLSSYNEVTSVANPDDVVTAPSVVQALRLTIVNNGGNDLQVFPASGDNIGAGVDGSITIGTGAVGIFLGRDGTDWDTLYNDVPSPSSTAAVPDPLLLSSGGVGVPTYSFSVDSNTGMYNPGLGLLGFTADGVEIARADGVASQFLVVSGVVAAPGYSFISDPDTGVFNTGADILGLAAGGVEVLRIVEAVGADQVIVSPGGPIDNPAAPMLAFGDGDTGIYENGDDLLRFAHAGVATWALTGSVFQGLAVDAPNMSNAASSAIVPNIRPNRSDGNTGIGQNAVDQISLIGGGVELLRAIEAGTSATDQVFLPRDGAEATPALALGALDRGFWSGGVAQINASIGGVRVQFFNSSSLTQFGSIGVSLAAGPRMLNETPSGTNPTVLARQNDGDSGLGSSVADAFTGVAGGVQAIDYAEASSRIIQTNANHVGLTASVTQTQVGGLALLSSYNEIATVANTGDALTAFGVAEGSRLVVVNNGANDLQLFPASGDDIGAGVDTAITIATGAIGIFLGRTAAIWDTLYNALPSPSGGGGGGLPEFQFSPLILENPNSADWTVNALAPAVADSNNAGLTVRLFDDTTEEGVGFSMEIPLTASNIIFTFRSRAETAPGVVNTVGLDIYNRGIPDNAAVQAWSAATQLTDISIPTNEFFQEDSQTIALGTLSLTAGELTQFELVRTLPGAGTDLTGDWVLSNLKVSFS